MPDYEERLLRIIDEDSHLMKILVAVERLNLNDAWICAGVIRNKVWDIYHQIQTPLNDIDVIYFDKSDTSYETEQNLEEKLNVLLPNYPWSVKNQARMHLKSGFSPYASSIDGVAHFPETPTAIAARKINNQIEIKSPYGLCDLFELNVRPTPYYKKGSDKYKIYLERVNHKKWEEKWFQLNIEKY